MHGTISHGKLLISLMTLSLQDRPQDYEAARGKYIIDKETMKILRKDAVIMHPLPRVDEVTDPCAFML